MAVLTANVEMVTSAKRPHTPAFCARSASRKVKRLFMKKLFVIAATNATDLQARYAQSVCSPMTYAARILKMAKSIAVLIAPTSANRKLCQKISFAGRFMLFFRRCCFRFCSRRIRVG